MRKLLVLVKISTFCFCFNIDSFVTLYLFNVRLNFRFAELCFTECCHPCFPFFFFKPSSICRRFQYSVYFNKLTFLFVSFCPALSESLFSFYIFYFFFSPFIFICLFFFAVHLFIIFFL